MKRSEINDGMWVLNLDDLEQVIGGNDGGGGEGRRVTCRNKNCSNPSFMIPLGKTFGTCPDCNAKVYADIRR